MSMGINNEIDRLPAQIIQIGFTGTVVQQAIDIVFYQQAIAVGIQSLENQPPQYVY